AMQNAMIPDLRVAGLEISPINVATDTAKFDLMLSVEAAAEGLKTAVEFSTDLFEAQTVRRLLRHYEALLESIVACPDERISRLRLLTREELDSISEKWASSREEPVNGLTIVEAFEEQARRRTDAAAVSFEGGVISYGELNRRANKVGRYLRKRGAG